MSESINSVKLVKYTLMHKDIPVLNMTLVDKSGSILDIHEIFNKDHLPIGTVRYGELDTDLLSEWWDQRSIPASRKNIESFLARINLPNTKYLLTKSMGLSLSDQYWIRNVDSDLSWSEVNFFENDFSEDIGNLLFGHVHASAFNPMSPDNTVDGVLKKRWKIIDGKRCLMKACRNMSSYESYNEIIASMICDVLKIPHVDYRLQKTEYDTLCICEDFIDSKTELVSAVSIINSYSSPTPISKYHTYVNACRQLGYNVVSDLDRMIVLDYIMENYDRHFRNFGLIRDAESLEILSSAPIFDTGSSLRCNVEPERFWEVENPSWPFEGRFDDQLKLVSSFDWIDFHKLYSVLDGVEALLSGTKLDKDGVADSIVELLDERITKLRTFVQSK
ncbi:MAG: HipA domain-containing protein [archaeon]|nr:HipA domain-containing protein [archaeon]